MLRGCFCASFSKVCPRVSEKLKRVHKGAMLIQKLGIIKCGWDDLVDYFWGLGMLKKTFHINEGLLHFTPFQFT